jgi:DNA-directed RNA polymerase specialized sigma24 family protein
VTLNNLEYWVLAQVGLEVVLILLLTFFLIKLRSMSKVLKNSQEEEKAVAGNLARLSGQLNVLETKRAALEETLSLLGEKASLWKEQKTSRGLAAQESYDAVPPKQRGTSLRLQVENLHLQGFSSAEIAHRLGLHPTEVKMAMDLARLKAE